MIDYIYYVATSTDSMGSTTVIEAQYFIPFLDFLMVAIVLSVSVLMVFLAKNLLYPDKYKINIKNNLRISKRLKDLWN